MIYDDLYEYILTLAPLPNEEWRAFLPNLNYLKCKKGDILLRPGEAANKIYIVREGVLRIFVVDANGKEFTKMFQGSFGFIGPYSECLQNLPARSFIQSIVASEVYCFNFFESRKFLNRHIAWETLSRKFAEINYINKEKREYSLLRLSASERYEEFKKDFANILDKIPQYQIASYLGIAPESFNRLLKKINQT